MHWSYQMMNYVLIDCLFAYCRTNFYHQLSEKLENEHFTCCQWNVNLRKCVLKYNIQHRLVNCTDMITSNHRHFINFYNCNVDYLLRSIRLHTKWLVSVTEPKQEAQLMLTTGAMRLAVSQGQQTWYHFGSVATFRYVGPPPRVTAEAAEAL